MPKNKGPKDERTVYVLKDNTAGLMFVKAERDGVADFTGVLDEALAMDRYTALEVLYRIATTTPEHLENCLAIYEVTEETQKVVTWTLGEEAKI
jgi:hypothetical protein